MNAERNLEILSCCLLPPLARQRLCGRRVGSGDRLGPPNCIFRQRAFSSGGRLYRAGEQRTRSRFLELDDVDSVMRSHRRRLFRV
jgi:hypothetical protein